MLRNIFLARIPWNNTVLINTVVRTTCLTRVHARTPPTSPIVILILPPHMQIFGPGFSVREDFLEATIGSENCQEHTPDSSSSVATHPPSRRSFLKTNSACCEQFSPSYLETLNPSYPLLAGKIGAVSLSPKDTDADGYETEMITSHDRSVPPQAYSARFVVDYRDLLSVIRHIISRFAFWLAAAILAEHMTRKVGVALYLYQHRAQGTLRQLRFTKSYLESLFSSFAPFVAISPPYQTAKSGWRYLIDFV